jgi:hypothetical protein
MFFQSFLLLFAPNPRSGYLVINRERSSGGSPNNYRNKQGSAKFPYVGFNPVSDQRILKLTDANQKTLDPFSHYICCFLLTFSSIRVRIYQ